MATSPLHETYDPKPQTLNPNPQIPNLKPQIPEVNSQTPKQVLIDEGSFQGARHCGVASALLATGERERARERERERECVCVCARETERVSERERASEREGAFQDAGHCRVASALLATGFTLCNVWIIHSRVVKKVLCVGRYLAFKIRYVIWLLSEIPTWDLAGTPVFELGSGALGGLATCSVPRLERKVALGGGRGGGGVGGGGAGVLCVIPARLAAVRFPGKLLKELQGVSVTSHSSVSTFT